MKVDAELFRSRNLITMVLCLCLSGLMPAAAVYGGENQDSSTGTPAREPGQKQDYTIRVGVEEVRVDAVVLNFRGIQVTDLTADDFSIYQDGKRQEITSCRYIKESMPGGDRKSAPAAASLPSRNEIQRTLLFVTDGMPPIYLKQFAEKGMQSGYLAGIVQLGTFENPLFVSDPRQLLSIINNWEWRVIWRGPNGIVPESGGFGASLNSIRHYIHVLENLPGRKNLVIMGNFGRLPEQYQGQARLMMDGLADEALRAGVVIHMLAEGGVTGNVTGDDSRLNYCVLAKKTGGVTVNSNWEYSSSGIAWIDEEMKGYYVLSYTPPENSFDKDDRGKFHNIKVRVKGWFREVHTRNGFYGGSKLFDYDLPVQNPVKLREALFSPFRYDDLKLHLASAYSSAPESGYLLKSWGRLDPDGLAFAAGDGGHAVSLETLVITEDTNGFILDAKGGNFDFDKNTGLDRIRKEGFVFDLSLPVKKPGGYYVCAAVKDRISGKIGKSCRFLEIPDLGNNHLALSSIFVMDHRKDGAPSGSADLDEGGPESDIASSGEAQLKSWAIRQYRPGEIIDYAVIVYNAKNKKGPAPELEYRSVLLKDGAEFLKVDFQAVSLEGIDDFSRIPIARRLYLGKEMHPGKYIFQITVIDKQAKKKHGATTQTIDFEIR